MFSKFDLSLDVDPSFDPSSLLASPEEDFPSSSGSDLDSPPTPISPISPTSLVRSDSIESYQSTATNDTTPLIINDPFVNHLYQHEQFLYHEERLSQSVIPSLTDNSEEKMSMNMNPNSIDIDIDTDTDTDTNNIPIKMESDKINSSPWLVWFFSLDIERLFQIKVLGRHILSHPSSPFECLYASPLGLDCWEQYGRGGGSENLVEVILDILQELRSSTSSLLPPSTSTLPPLPVLPVDDQFDVQLIEETKWNSAPMFKRYSMMDDGITFDWCISLPCLAEVIKESINNRARALQYQRFPNSLDAPTFQRRIKCGRSTHVTNMISSQWVINILRFRMTDTRTSTQIQQIASNLLHQLVQHGFA